MRLALLLSLAAIAGAIAALYWAFRWTYDHPLPLERQVEWWRKEWGR